MKKPNRRGVMALAVGSTAAALLIAGCSSSSSSSASQSGSAATSGSGTLVFGITADATQLVPWTATAEESVEVLQQLYSPLLDTDSNGNLIPGLASLPTVSDGGDTYTFTLNSGAKLPCRPPCRVPGGNDGGAGGQAHRVGGDHRRAAARHAGRAQRRPGPA